MAQKQFKMTDGNHGMLKGQAAPGGGPPDAFQKADPSMPKRSYRTDTEHEGMAVKPMKTKQGHESTGYVQMMGEMATNGIMEQAVMDKLNHSMRTGMEDGEKARLEEEEGRAGELTDAQIDIKQDSKNCDDDDLEVLRAKRRQQMKDAFDKKQKYQTLGHGSYDEIEEEVFLKTVTASERAVVHFYHNMFEKCKVMDMHLNKCARKFMGTRFVKLDAEKAPFFVEKLQIKTLPCAIVFVDGVAVERQVGFDGLSTGDEFDTVQLAWKIKEWGGLEEDFDPDDKIQWV